MEDSEVIEALARVSDIDEYNLWRALFPTIRSRSSWEEKVITYETLRDLLDDPVVAELVEDGPVNRSKNGKINLRECAEQVAPHAGRDHARTTLSQSMFDILGDTCGIDGGDVGKFLASVNDALHGRVQLDRTSGRLLRCVVDNGLATVFVDRESLDQLEELAPPRDPDADLYGRKTPAEGDDELSEDEDGTESRAKNSYVTSDPRQQLSNSLARYTKLPPAIGTNIFDDEPVDWGDQRVRLALTGAELVGYSAAEVDRAAGRYGIERPFLNAELVARKDQKDLSACEIDFLISDYLRVPQREVAIFTDDQIVPDSLLAPPYLHRILGAWDHFKFSSSSKTKVERRYWLRSLHGITKGDKEMRYSQGPVGWSRGRRRAPEGTTNNDIGVEVGMSDSAIARFRQGGEGVADKKLFKLLDWMLTNKEVSDEKTLEARGFIDSGKRPDVNWVIEFAKTLI